MVYAVRLDGTVDGHRMGRILLKYGLNKEYGIDLDKCCELLKNEHGKPYLKEYPDIFFNISHCKRMAVCVFGDTPVGIDVEEKRSIREGLLKRVLTKEEQFYIEALKGTGKEELEFIRFWTLKEAYGKAVGVGMLYDYKNTGFLNSEKLICPDKDYNVWHTSLDDGIFLSVCRRCKDSFEEAIEYVEVSDYI